MLDNFTIAMTAARCAVIVCCMATACTPTPNTGKAGLACVDASARLSVTTSVDRGTHVECVAR